MKLSLVTKGILRSTETAQGSKKDSRDLRKDLRIFRVVHQGQERFEKRLKLIVFETPTC